MCVQAASENLIRENNTHQTRQHIIHIYNESGMVQSSASKTRPKKNEAELVNFASEACVEAVYNIIKLSKVHSKTQKSLVFGGTLPLSFFEFSEILWMYEGQPKLKEKNKHLNSS